MKKIITRTLQLTLTSALTLLTHTAYSQGSGHALSFDGVNDYVSFSSLNAIGVSDFSWEGWYDFSNSQNSTGLFGNWEYNASCTSPYFYVAYGFPSNGLLTATFFHASGGCSNIYASYNATALVGWHHVAATYDRDGLMLLYLDGQQVASADISAWDGIDISNGNMTLGAGGPDLINWTSYCRGNLDEIRIWTKQLTAIEIRENMCQKLNGTEPNLAAYYRMDEGIDNSCSGGEDVCDLTGNGNHGTKM